MADVRLQQLAKSYGNNQVLRHIDLHIQDGEFMVFVGPSGCGKSTLLRMIAGLEEIDEGELLIGGARMNDTPPAQRGLAMVFQSYALYPHMTVFENMAFSLSLSAMAKSEIANAVHKAAAALQIIHLLDRKPRDLSGGQRQRVAIGRAIVRQPQLFLFDEPLSNLDASLRVQMRIELSKMHRELQSTMIYVTHDQVEAMTLGQRIAVFNGGVIEQVGTPLALYEHPANLFVAGFLGSPKMNFLSASAMTASAQGLIVQLTDGSLLQVLVDASDIQIGDKLTIGIRAEHLSLSDARETEQNQLNVNVNFVEHLGDTYIVYANFPGAENLLAAKFPATHQFLLAGQKLCLKVEAEHCYAFTKAGAALSRLTSTLVSEV
ncbi:ABC transporter ATP-binding protein [Undibacterium sp. Dicai25W]|uniref:ABC transporter ATP-binding protein n=1 Tax=Undibacterium sp. Dicai25W TaxID=3413034 RepID=UPI003BF3E103